jgi:hypothetical protein
MPFVPVVPEKHNLESGGQREMSLHSPFEWLSRSTQKRAFVPLVVFTLVVMASLQVLGGPLQTEAASAGIVSFEFAGELSEARSMIESWGQKGQVYAALSLGLDYLFLVAYASAIGLGCVLVGRHLSERVTFVGTLAVVLAWGQLAAALLDSIENYALIRVLLGSEQGVWPLIARWCAMPKFLIVAAGLLYIIIGAMVIVVRGWRGKKHGSSGL